MENQNYIFKVIPSYSFIFLVVFSAYLFYFFLMGMPYQNYMPNIEKKIETKVKIKIIRSGIAMATAYNSMVAQTDSDPWTTASGTKCRWGVVAANFLPFGTKIMIEGFGKQVFIVEDRMAKKHKRVIDIWFPKHKHAINYGRKQIKYWVVSLPR